MASATITTNRKSLVDSSQSRENHLNGRSVHSIDGAAKEQQYPPVAGNMSFSMSQPSQGSNLMVRPASAAEGYRRHDGDTGAHSKGGAFQIYSAVYSTVDVYEMEVNGIAVMRRRKDSWLNATQILKVAGIEKGKRTKVLEKEILIGEHEKVQGGYGKYQGTWIKFDRGVEFCRQYGVEEVLRPLLTYDMGQDGGVAGRGGKDTPTKEQAMAAQRKRLYNSKNGSEIADKPGPFFKNISATALSAVGAISKARYDSPNPRSNNAGNRLINRGSFSRQNSQQHLGSQESAFPGGSQQSMQSFASGDSFNGSQQDSAYATQFSRARDDGLNGDFEEPPRKRMRGNDSQQTIQDDYMMSLREVSPTEPNESFFYNQHMQTNGEYVALPPLPTPTSEAGIMKRELLMSLFTKEATYDWSRHRVFTTLTREDLDIPIDGRSNTALHWAATLARVSLVRVLMAHGASIFRVNDGGETALMRSCVVTNNLEKNTFPDILELLGPTIELRDAKGRTVLHHMAVTSAVKGRSQASKYYLEALLEFVVRQGSAPNSQQSSSQPQPLRSIGIGRFMSEIVNLQDRSGDTALNLASRIGNRSVISQLIEVGADVTIPNRSNLTPADFGIGDRADFDNARERTLNKPVTNDAKETSREIISSITTLLTDTETEFSKEIEKKQMVINDLHAQLREASGELGERRRRVESLQVEANEYDARKLKIGNLKRALDEEETHLQQLRTQYQYTQIPPMASEMEIGDADKGLGVPEKAANILNKLVFSPHQPLILERPDRQVLTASLPPAQVLRNRLNAYKTINNTLERNVLDLQRKDSELSNTYKKIIALCTNVAEKDVDAHMGTILRSLESEREDLESTRVREFLTRVSGD